MNFVSCVIFLSVLSAIQAAPSPKPKTSSYMKQAVVSQTPGAVHISANHPRPLAQTLDALQQKYGWIVDYEDPRYTAKADLVSGTGATALLPSGGNFDVEFPVGMEEAKALQKVVDSYNQSKNPGRFELRHEATGDFYVVGTGANDEKGNIATQAILFDHSISVMVKQRTVAETISLILQKLALRDHTTITLGVAPTSVLLHNMAKVGGTKVSARELLLKTLASTNRQFYWRLLFDPNSKGYYLDLHAVPKS
jgi:hypothetical protein